MNAKRLIQNLKDRHLVKSSESVGVLGLVGKEVRVDTDNGNRDLIVLATTEDIDIGGDVVIASGVDMSYFAQNKSIFVDHCMDVSACVAKLRRATPYPSLNDHKGWLVRMRVLSLAGNPIGDDILTITREGGIGVSIGYIPTDFGPPTIAEIKAFSQRNPDTGKLEEPERVIRKWKWLELSLTCFPMNVNCQTLQSSGTDEKRLSLLDELVTKGRIHRNSAALLGLRDAARKVPERPLLCYTAIGTEDLFVS